MPPPVSLIEDLERADRCDPAVKDEIEVVDLWFGSEAVTRIATRREALCVAHVEFGALVWSQIIIVAVPSQPGPQDQSFRVQVEKSFVAYRCENESGRPFT